MNFKKVLFITGSTDGIGKNCLNYLIKENNLKLILTARNLEKGGNVVRQLKEINPNADITLMKMDLESQESIKKCVKEFKEMDLPLDILVNNAGVFQKDYFETVDGFESTLAINHLGPFLLTRLLLDKLKESKQPYGANVVMVTSKMHSNIRNLNFDTEFLIDKTKFSTGKEYGKSKLYNIWFARELQKRINENNLKINVNSLHPGFNGSTNIFNKLGYFAKNIYIPFLVALGGNNISTMGQALYNLSINNENLKNQYIDVFKISKPSNLAQDFEKSKILWDNTCEILSLPKDL